MPQPVAAVAPSPDYSQCLSAHPYYLTCIKMWAPPPSRLAVADANIKQAVPHLVHLLEDGAVADAKKLYAAAEPLLRQTGFGDLDDALRALIHVYEKDFIAAARDAAAASRAQPGCAEYHYLCGISAAQMRDISSAVTHCRRALELNPDLGLAAMALALIYTLNRDWPEGLAFARRAKKHEKEFNPFLVDLCLLACSWRCRVPNESLFDLSALNEPPLSEAERQADLSWLPKVEWPAIAPAPLVIFIYCDHNYLLEHAAPLAWSLAEVGARDILLHFHIPNPQPATANAVEEIRTRSGLSVSWSEEEVDSARYGNLRAYHVSARFCRGLQFLAHAKNPVLMIDSDILFRKHPRKLDMIFDPSTEIAVQHCPGSVFWETVCGTGLFARPCPGAFDFLGTVSRFILRNLKQNTGRWYLDEIALGMVFERDEKRLTFTQLPFNLTADSTYSDEAVMWSVFVEKNADDRYNAYKRELLAKYGDLRGMKN